VFLPSPQFNLVSNGCGMISASSVKASPSPWSHYIFVVFTREILELNGNKVTVLPNSFGELKAVRVLNVDMNPLQSPPLSLLNAGIGPVVKYCIARSTLIGELSGKLKAAGRLTSLFLSLCLHRHCTGIAFPLPF